MYVSKCASHYYRRDYEGLDRGKLLFRRQVLLGNLRALEEQRLEILEWSACVAAELRAHLDREELELRARLAAIDELTA